MHDYHIPVPCHEDWERMTPAERGRHCTVCDQVVVDLTACSPVAGRALLARAQAAAGATGVCARVPVDARRRVRFGGFRRHVLTNGLALLLATGAVAGCEAPPQVAMGGLQADAVEDPPAPPEPVDPAPVEPDPTIMGEVVAVEEPVPAIAPPEPAPVPDHAVMGRVAPHLPPVEPRQD